jgi:hypothetical protein
MSATTDAHACGVTLLRTVGTARATKRWIWDPATDAWRKVSYSAGARFQPQERTVGSLRELATVLEAARSDPRTLVVRGALTPATREKLARDPDLLIRRIKLAKAGRPDPTLHEVPRRWVPIDIDGFPLNGSDDLVDDPESAIDRAIVELLPPAFHDAECWWQLSSSAGFVPGILKVHLYFWLSEPTSNEHLRQVFAQHAPGVDRAPFGAAQPLYIADPIIEGGHDPLPRRTGWRKGMEASVVLPPLDPDWHKPRPASLRPGAEAGGIGGDLDDALDRLGDGEGRDGFHAPLRLATMRYAVRCARYGGRDDAALKVRLRTAIHTAPRSAGRCGWEDYAQDDYLDRLLDGAFALLAGDADIRKTPPEVTAPTATVAGARHEIRLAVHNFLGRTTAWWATEPERRGDPEHAGIGGTTGSGKSSITRDELVPFIAAMKAAGLPHRVLWLVPHHRLSNEAADAMHSLGINAAIMRGRDALVAPEGQERACLNLPAASDARLVGADVEQSVCGPKQQGKPRCPSRDQCLYQAQKAAVARADVVIAAHQHLFHARPAAMGEGFGLVVADESWWQAGLNPNREIPLEGFVEAVARDPALQSNVVINPMPDPDVTAELSYYAEKLARALATLPNGGYVTQQALTGEITAAECEAAAKAEWLRKRFPNIRPGMSEAERKEAVRVAEVNSTLPRRAALWRTLGEFLLSQDDTTGRIEVTVKDGGERSVVLHSRHDINETLAGLPILLLDATMPPAIVRRFLPRLTVLVDIQIAAPHATVIQVVGPFGKTSLVPHPSATDTENKRRNGLLAELRDYVAFHGMNNALTIAYKAVEDRFREMRGGRTAHHGAIAGIDSFGQVDTAFIIGNGLPSPADLRAMTLALTGKPVLDISSGRVTRGALLADGSGAAIQVRAYTAPDMEAVRAATADAAAIQNIGRTRPINRGADNPTTIHVLANVLLPMPLNRLVRWQDVRLTPIQRMAARGLVLTSPSDMTAFFPDLFSTRRAAKWALEVFPAVFPMSTIPIGGTAGNTLSEYRYRPAGRGQQTRRALVADWRADTIRDELEEVLGPLVVFEVVRPVAQAAAEAVRDHAPVATPEPEPVMAELTPAAIAAMTDDAKLALRARLQTNRPAQPDGAAPVIPGGYGDALPPAALAPAYVAAAPVLAEWKVRDGAVTVQGVPFSSIGFVVRSDRRVVIPSAGTPLPVEAPSTA